MKILELSPVMRRTLVHLSFSSVYILISAHFLMYHEIEISFAAIFSLFAWNVHQKRWLWPREDEHFRVISLDATEVYIFHTRLFIWWYLLISRCNIIWNQFDMYTFIYVLICMKCVAKVYQRLSTTNCCLRPYHVEHTGSRPITEVKQRRARSVLGWVTAWEYRVL